MDNVFIERLWRSLKHEDICLKGYADGREAKAGIANWIAFYNDRRVHQALGYRTPTAVWRERMQAANAVDMMDNADALHAHRNSSRQSLWQRDRKGSGAVSFQLTSRFERSRSAGPFHFRHSEAPALKPIAGRPPFQAARELIQRVHAECAVEIDGNAYSVPWRRIGETVRATIADRVVRIHHRIHEVAVHPICVGRRGRVVAPKHFDGLTGFNRAVLPSSRYGLSRRRRRGCCGRSASTKLLWEGASDASHCSRPPERYVDAPETDGCPRPAGWVVG